MIYLAAICGLQILVIIAMIEAGRRERQEVRAERADLLQRIQAPQHAVVAHYNENTPNFAPPAVNPDIDEDYFVSKEDLAEMMAREETS